MAQASANPFDQQRPIPGVQKVLAVGSGKGGVGKSTVATNLALALSRQKLNVGLLDADLYGPSLPRMLGALKQKPEIDENNRLQPIERYGLQLMSIGFLIDENSAVVWRGPMLFKAINQFLYDVAWKNLDLLVVDLPPGTGDVQLSLAQKVPVDAGVLVSTPQNLSLVDAKKAFDMFERLGIRTLGCAENMSYLEQAGEKIPLFPKGDLETFLEGKELKKLVEIPFFQDLGKAAETGIPLLESQGDHPACAVFEELARKVKQSLW